MISPEWPPIAHGDITRASIAVQRLRRSTNLDSAPLIAASVFLDALHVFLFVLRLYRRNDR